MATVAHKRKNPPRIDETGVRHGRLVGVCRDGDSGRKWIWQCDCGNVKSIDGALVRNGNTSSCGCLRAELSAERKTKHGLTHSGSMAFNAWVRIRARTIAKSGANYRDYVLKGITLCEEWATDAAAFVAYIGEPPEAGMSIDRIDNSKGYEPGNVRWATAIQQANNKTNNRFVEYKGERVTLSEMIRRRAADEGVPESTMRSRVEKALYG